ncbi:MAG: 1,4-alpha-glucan branching protein GlgB [Streptosporangiales bacterium]|nr:1,4-alpha-glucan branching protein GlgB [Streptosporangiales bacterium]
MSEAPGELADQLRQLAEGTHHDPHGLLGCHRSGDTTVIRALRPAASAVTALLADGSRLPLTHVDAGVYTAEVAGAEPVDYRLEVGYGDDTVVEDDAYRFLPTLGDVDLHLFNEGRHEQLWTVLGAHVRRYKTARGDVVGTSFAVWAPNAKGVRVVGDFNHWDGHSHPMRMMGSSGVWELFVPEVTAGVRYKFAVLGADWVWRHKADPMAFATEQPPATASVVYESTYEWADDAWLARRERTNPTYAPMSAYEVHLGSWRPGLSYVELADQLVAYVRDLGFTHVEFLPVAEHPFGGSWGYQVTSYYAPSSRFGHPDEFRHLVDRLHQAGIGVLVDWVPAHFPKDAWALARFDGTTLYEHGDPRQGEHPDWGTLVFDYGRHEVRNFLVANALYWLEEFHVDGLRVDAVASMLYLDYSRKEGEWVPNRHGGRENLEAIAFLQETNATIYKRVPGAVTIAEESTSWSGVSRATYVGGLGFGFKWNMGWMHDTLGYLARDPIHRQFHHHELTFSMMYAYSENFVLPLSHDEVVHGKGSLYRRMPGDHWRKLAGLRALYAYMWAHPGKQLVFMGAEFGQDTEWSEQDGLAWFHLDQPDRRGLQTLIRDLNLLYADSPALWEQDHDPQGFSWIDADDSTGNTLSFLRRAADGTALACVVNFSAVPHIGYRLGLPAAGRWREALNTDAHPYGGSGVGNFGVVQATTEPWHGQPASTELTIPPLGALWLVPEPESAD